MNLGELKVRVKRTFGDESAVQVTDQDITRWANDGQREIVMINTGLLEKIATTDAVEGQQDYAKPSDMLILHGLTYKSKSALSYYKLEGRSLQEFDQQVDGWDGTLYGPADPIMYCEFADTLKLFPIPDVNVTAAIKLYYARYPIDLSVDSDIIDLPVTYHSSVVDYCLQRAYELDEDLQSATLKSGQFIAAVNEQKNREKWNNQEFYPTITVMSDDLYDYLR